MSESLIGAHPPGDGREWENQCARCGSSMLWIDCCECGGDGFFEAMDLDVDDEIWESERMCDCCNGRGGWYECLSSAKFCKEYPLPGREETKRGQIEWWTLEKAREV